MYLEEYEEIEIILTRINKNWIDKIGKYEINTPIKVNWKLIKKSTFRNFFMNVKCDDCGIIHKRRLKDLKPEINIHYCKKCYCKGEKNIHFGKSQSEKTKLALEKWRSENKNPFTWESVKEKIKKHPNNKSKYEKIRGIKRSQEIRDKISKSSIESFKSGKRKISSGWGNIKIKKYLGIDYQSSYELRFLKFIESLGKLDIIERGPIVSYFIGDKEHTYHSDFKIKNTNIVFEIKSTYLWNRKLETNLLKKEAAEKIYQYFIILDNNFENIKEIINEF